MLLLVATAAWLAIFWPIAWEGVTLIREYAHLRRAEGPMKHTPRTVTIESTQEVEL